MSEKEIQNLIDIAEAYIHKGVTAEEALSTFVGAGIMTTKGELTPPYQEMINDANAQG